MYFYTKEIITYIFFFFFSSRRRHTRFSRDWSSDVCSSDLDLEREIHASVADLTTLASEIEQQVSGSLRDLKRELREAARETRASAPRGRAWGPPRTGAGSDARAAELERAVGELAAQVRRLVRHTGVTEAELGAATAVVTSAITEVRRLLGG